LTLTSGDRIGGYEVVALLDQGGQGAVYRARDTTLSRDVALKVLARERFDDRRRARFEREAQALALLNHPNIATLHGVEHTDDVAALVMELVEGESLAARLARGAIPVTEALALARQIADALEAAHEHGIVHRDLKPANVMIRPDGTVKVLDFGLAKPIADTGAGAAAATVTATGDGPAIVGTAAYMSPEQARGAEVDRRTDVWAFGCVLYEMLTGRRAFDGATASDAIVAVLSRDPDLAALRAETPDGIRRLIRRCLEKDVRHRLRDIGDARLEIDDAGAPGAPASGSPSRFFGWRHWAALVISAAVGVGAGWVFRPLPPPSRPPVSRLPVLLPESAPLVARFGHTVAAIAPDGARFAYTTRRGFAVRSRDLVEVDLLQELGTFPIGPFFSPDGQWLGFIDGAELKRMPIAGGRPTTIAEVGPGAVASWGPDGIVVADQRGLFLIAREGGEPKKLQTTLAPNEQALHPQLLRGGHAVVFTVLQTRGNILRNESGAAAARIDLLDLRTSVQKTLVQGGSRAQVLPTGHLVYLASQGLMATRFDAQRLEISGRPVFVEAIGGNEFALSEEGTLIFPAGLDSRFELVWVDRHGREESLGAPTRRYVYPRVSPTGDRIAVVLFDGATRDVDIWDLKRRTMARLTPDPTDNGLIAWHPNGTHLAFSSDRYGVANLFWQSADGTGTPERLRESDRTEYPVTFAPDGRLLFSADVPGRGRDIHAFSLETRKIEPVIESAASELNASVSRDGRWIAYDSNESGQFEVYIRPYEGARDARRWQISSGGGRQPVFSHEGRELFYRDFTGAMMAVSVNATPTLAAGAVTRLFDGDFYVGAGSVGGGVTYDVAKDGRFLMIKSPVDADHRPSLVVVQNWFEELQRLVPTK
jgi:tRNA A-37 threonylcarbamoyl transferase component Bud32